MESDMEKQGGKRRREAEEEEEFSDACNLAVDAETERCPKKAREEPEGNVPAQHRDLISQLPDLIQDKVFGFLDVRDKVTAAKVCSSWWVAVYRPCQWREVMVRLDLDKLSEEGVSSLKQRKIRHIFVENVHAESKALDDLHDCLVSVDLGEVALPLSVLQKVFCRSFSSLRRLCVYMDNKESLEFQGVKEVFQHLSNLEYFELEVEKCDNDVVEAVGTHLKRLKDFSLTASGHAACSLEFLGHLSSLQSLSLDNVCLSGVDFLKTSCKTLQEVSFRWCSFDTAGWPEIVSQMPPLEELTLYSCTPAVEDGLNKVTEGQRNLKVLTYHHASKWSSTSDPRSLARMPNLEEFSVGGCHFESEDDFTALSCGFKNLRALEIWNCCNVIPAFMKGKAGLPSLQELCLSQLVDVDGTSLEMISKGSCQLRTLTLKDCPKISGEDMKHVAGMSSLRELNLLDLKLGSSGINYLKEGSLKLEVLNVEKCGWTFQDVKPWLEKQQSLQRLILVPLRMTEAEKTEAQNLKNVLPHLREVYTL